MILWAAGIILKGANQIPVKIATATRAVFIYAKSAWPFRVCVVPAIVNPVITK